MENIPCPFLFSITLYLDTLLLILCVIVVKGNIYNVPELLEKKVMFVVTLGVKLQIKY